MRAIYSIILAASITARVVAAQEAATPALAPSDIAAQAETGAAAESTPFDVEAGTEALVVKGNNLLWLPADVSATAARWVPYVNYDVNGQFSYDEAKDRIADLAIEAATLRSFGVVDPFDCTPNSGIRGADVIPYVEARGRFADIAKNDDTDWKGVLIGGAGIRVRLHSPKLMNLKGITGADVENPTLALTYYNAFVDRDEETPASADTSIALDQIQLAFTADLPLAISTDAAAARKFLRDRAAYICDPTLPVPKRPNFPYTVSIALKAGRPTSGDDRDVQFHADVALKMIKPDDKIGFVLRYRTGDDLGFEYDTQLLAGLLFRVLD